MAVFYTAVCACNVEFTAAAAATAGAAAADAGAGIAAATTAAAGDARCAIEYRPTTAISPISAHDLKIREGVINIDLAAVLSFGSVHPPRHIILAISAIAANSGGASSAAASSIIIRQQTRRPSTITAIAGVSAEGPEFPLSL